MVLESFTDVRAFQAKVLDMLLTREAENNLMIGLLDRGVEGLETEGWYMARVTEGDGSNRLAALMTPPHNLILVGDGLSKEAVVQLAIALDWANLPVPGVIAENALAHAFASSYTIRREQTYRVQTQERIYRLNSVSDVPLVGTLRAAEARDLHYLPYWMKGFYDECFHTNEPVALENVQKQVQRGALYVLEADGQPVSMAGSTRRMPHGRSVGPVYTPPYFRGHGYATACVALLSRRILDEGYDYCVLFTNLANPTSNHIYQTIGYRPLGDVAEIRFSDEGRDPR